MSEVTGLRNVALPYPVYGVPFGLTFPILDADGDPVSGASGLDSEVSKNGDTYADCTNEATEIATSSGTYYLLLTATEMTADVVSIIVKTSTTGAKTTILTLYPRKLVPLRSGTAQGGAAGYITLDAGAGSRNDMWNGCLCVATIDSNIEARIIDDYNGSNQQASVTPDWNVTPDSDDAFIIYLPEGMQIPDSNVTAISGSSNAANLLAALHDALETLTVDDANFTPTTTQAQFTAAVDLEDEYLYQGLFGLTGANAGVTVWCSAYAYDSGNSQVRLTFDALETAPANGDTFVKIGRRRAT